jgi:hypothetical protein
LSHFVRRNHCLAKTEAAVSAWHFTLDINLQAILFKLPAQALRKVQVIERTSAQANAIEPRALANKRGDV